MHHVLNELHATPANQYDCLSLKDLPLNTRILSVPRQPLSRR